MLDHIVMVQYNCYVDLIQKYLSRQHLDQQMWFWKLVLELVT